MRTAKAGEGIVKDVAKAVEGPKVLTEEEPAKEEPKEIKEDS